jgi:hypothetical protein
MPNFPKRSSSTRLPLTRTGIGIAVATAIAMFGLGATAVSAVGPTLPSKPATTKAAAASSSGGSTKSTASSKSSSSSKSTSSKSSSKASATKSSPGFSLVSNPTRRRIGPGDGTKLQVDLRRASGFTGVVAISASGVPKGVKLSYPRSIRQFAPVTVTTDPEMREGTYRITFTGTSGSKRASTVFTLVVDDIYLTPGSEDEEETPANEEDTLPPAAPGSTPAPADPNATTTSTTSTSTTTTTTPGLVRSLSSTTIGFPTTATTLAAGDFTAAFTTNRLILPVGGTTAINLVASGTGGVTPNPVVVVSGLPAGVTAAVGANSGGVFRVSLTAGATVPAGSFVVTASATEAGRVKTATTEVVVVADMGIWLSPHALNASPGGSVQTTITVSNTAAFTAPVALSISGLPAGVAPTVGAQSLNNTSTTLTLTIGQSVAPGTYPFTISGTGGGQSKSASGTLTIATAPPPTVVGAVTTLATGTASTVVGATTVVGANNTELTLSVLPQTASIPANGGVMRYTITVTGTALQASAATITVGGLPANTTSSITPNPTNSTATLTITSALPATFGSYTITISATAGTQTRTQTAALVLT